MTKIHIFPIHVRMSQKKKKETLDLKDRREGQSEVKPTKKILTDTHAQNKIIIDSAVKSDKSSVKPTGDRNIIKSINIQESHKHKKITNLHSAKHI